MENLEPSAQLGRRSVNSFELLGEVKIPTGETFSQTEIGGLSGLAYDPVSGLYYALSDDRSSDARFYTLEIDLSEGEFTDGRIKFTDFTLLRDKEGGFFENGSLDPEGIALGPNNTLYISSEGDASRLINPFIREIALDGSFVAELPIPEGYLPTADQTSGIRNNLAFESLTISPDQKFLYTATENALFQDGLAADVDQPSLSRITKYDLATGQPVASFVYEIEAVPDAPVPADGFRTNGLVELLAVDNNGTLLALERAFSAGVGNTVKLFEIQTQGALDVLQTSDLFRETPLDDGGEIVPPGPFEIDPAVRKRELLDIERDLGIAPDNLEALAFGPTLADGRQSLIVVSDNNFSAAQSTQFLALALSFDTTPVVLPTVETPLTQDDSEAITPLRGDSDDPAIWINPANAEDSRVIATLKDGGLVVFDLAGTVVQTILPDVVAGSDDEAFGSIRYNNVDLLYGVEIPTRSATGALKVDLAIASDRENDTLAIFSIRETSELSDITLPLIGGINDPDFSIFGVDDGEATAYGLATYKSPVNGKAYVFVTQADGNKVAQLELIPNASGGAEDFLPGANPVADIPYIEARVVRTIELPVPTGDVEDSQSEGIVVDQEKGLLYVALEDEVGILRFSAEPTGGNDYQVIQPVGADYLVPDIEGLSIYYGPGGSGYLIANSQGDSSYAVFSREGTNEYLGSFVVGDNGGIDQVNESDGLDIINVALGSAFPNGLVVLQDGANDPQNVAEDDEELENNSTNFKFVPWESVANGFANPLTINTTSYDPRNPSPQSLVNGVASGDVDQDSAVLWARSTFLGKVTFEYSTDASFGAIAGSTTATVTDVTQPVKVEVEGLESGTEYFYRVTDAAGAQQTGRFDTAAALGEQTGLNFGVVGDWRGEIAPYPAIRNVAEKELDFFLLHGDTIYADDDSPAVLNPDGTLKAQAATVEEYRAKHNEVYSERFGENFWADVRASTAIYATIDDHEVTNDFAGGQTIGTDPRFQAAFLEDDSDTLINDSTLYENGLQVFQEFNPIRDEFYGETEDEVTANERKLYRYNTFGSDAAAFVLDTRSFRDPAIPAPANFTDPNEVAAALAATFTPGRTLLGNAQKADLKADLLDAQENGITWKFIMVPEPFQTLFPGINTDAWDGYNAERTELLKFIEDNDIENVVFAAADVHMTSINNITYQEEPFGEIVATSTFEITTGAVAYEDPTGVFLGNLFTAANPELRAFYDSLPIAPDGDDEPNDKDDFVKAAINDTLLTPLGYDPIGLDDNLPQAEGLIDATLLQGDYYVGHSSSWAEFDINPLTQKLTITTWGIDGYTEAELLADPDSIVNQTPRILSQFEVNPTRRTTPIYEIQGAGHLSAFGGESVTTQGIVTAVDFNGFYLQDATGDGDNATSDGLFVFVGDTPSVSVGDEVELIGTVFEFIPGGAGSGNLSTTQLSVDSEDAITILSSDNEIPAAVLIGQSGRVAPSEIVISDDELPVNLQESAGNFDLEEDAIDFYESLEGMRVTVEDAVAVSPTRVFNAFSAEAFTLPNQGATATPDGVLTARGGINLESGPDNTGDQNPERVQIQFNPTLLPEGFSTPQLTVGDTLGDVTGVLGYSFGNFEVNVTEAFSVTSSGLEQEVSALTGSETELTVASYNVLNLSATEDDNNQRNLLAEQIVTNLNSPDIIGLQEIQDNNGAEGGAENTETDASETLQALVDAIAAAGGPTYAFADIAPAANSTGGAPGSNIRNSFLYNPDRVSLESIELLDGLDAFDGSRRPLVGEFLFNGETLTTVNNHFSSRFGSTPIFGGPQPFVQAAEDEREAQAQAVNDFVDGLIAADADAKVVVLGDLNTFEFTNDLTEILPGVGDERVLTSLIDQAIADDDAYTFIFDGNSQVLDNFFVSDSLLSNAKFEIVHVNNDFTRDDSGTLFTDTVVASDHEPILAKLRVQSDTTSTPSSFAPNGDGSSVELTNLDGASAVRFSPSNIQVGNASELRVFKVSGDGVSTQVGAFSVLKAGEISSDFMPSFSVDAIEGDTLRFELVDSDGGTTSGITSIGSDGNGVLSFGRTTLSLVTDDGTSAPNLVIDSDDDDSAAALDFTTQTGDQSSVSFSVFREAAYDSTVGLYVVDDLTGQVTDAEGNVFDVGDEGYAAAALSRAVDGLSLSTSDGGSATITQTIDNALFGMYISVQDPDFETTQTYFSFSDANGDSDDHVKLLGSNAIGFEDLPGLGDADFNDLVISFEVSPIS